MKTSDVKRIIQQFAREEFVLYPESFSRRKGSAIQCCSENIIQWARNMWDSRTEEEIERDYNLGLHPDNYVKWAFEEFRRTMSLY